MKSFKVSVIIPVYNAEKFLEKAVESALQHDCVKEIILIEDNSPDNALEICRTLESKFEPVKLYRHPNGENRGAGASRNLGIDKATSEFIAFLDADDFYLPNRFDKEKDVFRNHIDADGVYGAIGSHYYGKGKNKNLFNDITTVHHITKPEDFLKARLSLKYKNFGDISICSLTLKRASIDKENIRFNEKLRLHQDTDFLIKVAFSLKLYPGEIIKPITMRGVHANNRFTQHAAGTKKFADNKILYFEELLKWLNHKKAPYYYKLPFYLEKFYYESIKNKKNLLLAKIILKLRYRLYLMGFLFK